MATTEPLEITGLVVPAEDRTLAESIVKAIRKSGSVRLEADGTTFVVPESAAKQIVSILTMTAGSIPSEAVPAASELTVPQAMEFLGMSERHLNDLLDENIIASRKDGDRRLVSRDSILAFLQEREQRRAILDEMTRESQEMGLYD